MTQNIDLKIICIDNLGKPFPPPEKDKKNNNYCIFNVVQNRYGVYIFVDASCDILYVGKAQMQSLQGRITQYYTESDTGGTFRKNWCEENGDFEKFKEALENWKILTISTSKKNDNWIQSFESELIQLLDPKYNRSKK